MGEVEIRGGYTIREGRHQVQSGEPGIEEYSKPTALEIQNQIQCLHDYD